MNSLTLYSLFLLFVSTALFSFAIISADRSRRRVGFYPFMLLLVLSLWTLNSALADSASGLQEKVLLLKIWFLTGSFTPTIFLLFCLKFTFGTSLVKFPWALTLFILPLVFGILALTNDGHRLLWAHETISSYGNLSIKRTPLNYVYLILSYAELLAGMVCLLVYSIRSRGLSRIQTTILFIAGLVPVSTNIFLNLIDPMKTLPDITPLTFAVTGLLGAWTVLHFRLFQWAPVAREKLLDSSQDGMLFLDQDGYFLDANHRALSLMGLKAIPYGKRVQDMVFPKDFPRTALCSNTMDSYKWSQGNGQFWEATVNEILGSGKIRVGYMHHWRDVTLVTNYIDHMERDRQKIENLLEERSTLLHVITHDISNSLGVIYLWTDPENDLEPTNWGTLKKELFEASKSSIELITFVRNLLSAEDKSLKLVTVDLAAAVDEAKGLVNHRGEGKSLKWEISGSPEVYVLGEPISMVHSVFANLFSNAQKFSPFGGTIEVRWTVKDDSVVLHVLDQGLGVESSRVPGLFRFETNVSTQGTAGERGSGFGLPLARKFLSLYGATIDYHPRKPQGSEFIIHFKSAKA